MYLFIIKLSQNDCVLPMSNFRVLALVFLALSTSFMGIAYFDGSPLSTKVEPSKILIAGD